MCLFPEMVTVFWRFTNVAEIILSEIQRFFEMFVYEIGWLISFSYSKFDLESSFDVSSLGICMTNSQHPNTYRSYGIPLYIKNLKYAEKSWNWCICQKKPPKNCLKRTKKHKKIYQEVNLLNPKNKYKQ